MADTYNAYFFLPSATLEQRTELWRWIRDELNYDYRDALVGQQFKAYSAHRLDRCIIQTVTPARFYGVIFKFFDEADAILFKLIWGEYCLQNDIIDRDPALREMLKND